MQTETSSDLKRAALVALSEGDTEAQRRAIETLAEHGAPVVPELVELLDRQNRTNERSAWLTLFRMVHRDMQPDARDALTDALVTELQKEHATRTREQLCELIGYGGSARCVDPLYRMLLDMRVREAVRQALIRLPFREAVQALVAGLQITEGDFLIALLDAIGRKREPATLPILVSWSQSTQAPAREAALDAIGRLPSRHAMEALRAAVRRGVDEAVGALLRSGQTLLRDDRTADAREAFLDVVRYPEADAPLVVGAVVGLGRVGRAEDIPLLLKLAEHPRWADTRAPIERAVRRAVAALQNASTEGDT